MADKHKFPTEVIDLPSEGRVYPADSPLKDGKIEVKYMTAKEEDILTSQNLIKKGIVIEKLLDSLIITEGVKSNDLIIGDKNALMVAARILAYGPEYTTEIIDPNTGDKTTYTFNLADCPFKKLPDGASGNQFDVTLPVSKIKIKFKLLTGKDEQKIDSEIKAAQKFGSSTEITTRLRHSIVEIDGNDDQNIINQFVDSMLSRDSLYLRQEMIKTAPDLEMMQEIELEGDVVEVNIPLTIDFFWPKTI